MSTQDDLSTIRNFFEEGGTLQALLSLSPTDLDHVYGYACQLFNAGNYANAKRFYMLLSRLSHWQYDYWLGLGLCCQRLEEHEEAIFCFGQAAVLRIDDPKPAYLAGISYNMSEKLELARRAFISALKWCADKPQYCLIKTEILSRLIPLSKESQNE